MWNKKVGISHTTHSVWKVLIGKNAQLIPIEVPEPSFEHDHIYVLSNLFNLAVAHYI